MPDHADLIVIGGGIVGLATADRWTHRDPTRRVIVLEKEPDVARHQTGRNSGVIHSGLYYKPGSLKARTCRRGKAMLEAFCQEHRVPWERCGKVVVALDQREGERLDALAQRGLANGVECRPIDRTELRRLEPHVAGVRGLHVPETGIVDYVAVCRKLAERIENAGGEVRTRARAAKIVRTNTGAEVELATGERLHATQIVNCAGLHADRVARLASDEPQASIVPFRGEYFELKPDARGLCKNLIYPVPDPAFPFLGVHFTRMVERDEYGPKVECGPNAVLAFAREGYTNRDIDLDDLAETLGSASFWRLALRHWRTGAGEMWRSFSKPAFVRALQRLMPDVRAEHLEPAPAGVRAQALAPGGRLLDDFSITADADGRVVHVVNAPSPAATASLAIAEMIADVLDGRSTPRA